MPNVDLRSIEPLVPILLICMRPKYAVAKRREQCLTASKVTGLARPRDAQSAMASLVSSGIIRGEPRFAPRSASIVSGLAAKVIAFGWAGYKCCSTNCQRTTREPHDASDITTRQAISQNCRDFDPRRPNNDRPSGCDPTQDPRRRLRAASREGFPR